MKRNTVVLLLVLLALSAVAVWVYLSKSGKLPTREDADRQFAFKDTAEITSIFIADKEGNSSHVRRGANGWRVNDKYDCRPEAILNLLEVIRNVEVRAPVPKTELNGVMTLMVANAIKVEVYSGDELVKQFYVGHETADGEGSYMLLTDIGSGKNFVDPYVCFIPGFVGYLQPRFIANENEWRDRVVVDFIPPQITTIQVAHHDKPDSSFTIELLNTTTFRLKNAKGEQVPFDEQKLKQYLVYYRNVSYEGLITGRNQRLQDSLRRAGPFCTITVATTDYKQHHYDFFRKAYDGKLNPEIGVHYDYDPNRLYLNFDAGKEWAIVQYFVFGKLFVNTGYFSPARTVKK
jgi:hypothetical protein